MGSHKTWGSANVHAPRTLSPCFMHTLTHILAHSSLPPSLTRSPHPLLHAHKLSLALSLARSHNYLCPRTHALPHYQTLTYTLSLYPPHTGTQPLSLTHSHMHSLSLSRIARSPTQHQALTWVVEHHLE